MSGLTLTPAALWGFRCALGLTAKGLWQCFWLQSQVRCCCPTTKPCACSSLGLEDSPLLLPLSAQTPSGRSSDYCALQGVPQLHQVCLGSLTFYVNAAQVNKDVQVLTCSLTWSQHCPVIRIAAHRTSLEYRAPCNCTGRLPLEQGCPVLSKLLPARPKANAAISRCLGRFMLTSRDAGNCRGHLTLLRAAALPRVDCQELAFC